MRGDRPRWMRSIRRVGGRRAQTSPRASRERNETNEPDDDRTPVLTCAARAPIERSHPRVASRANAIARVEPDERAVKKRLYSIHRSTHRVHPAARPRIRPPHVRARARDARISRASSRSFRLRFDTHRSWMFLRRERRRASRGAPSSRGVGVGTTTPSPSPWFCCRASSSSSSPSVIV